MYFIGDLQYQAQNSYNRNPTTNLELIVQLQVMLHSSNRYIQSFKYALENVPTTEYKIILNADMRPPTEHARRFNLPECNEVAVIITGQEHMAKDTLYLKIETILCNS